METILAEAQPTAGLRHGRMLLVGFDKSMRSRLHAVVGTLGYAPDMLAWVCDIADADTLPDMQTVEIALIDAALPQGGATPLIRALRQRLPAAPIVVLSQLSAGAEAVNALRAGATGYVLKERDDIEITLCLRNALRGGRPIDPFVAGRILEYLVCDDARTAAPCKGAGERALLSAREIEILASIDKGSTNREIADTLSLSRLTVESHIKNIYKKLAVGSRTQALFEARSRGLLR